jgi:Kef-type K+ transport system membrane component KefB
MVLLTAGYALFMIFVARPLLRKAIRWEMRRGDGKIGLSALAVFFAILFLCAIATNLIGIFAIFGAFLLGAVLSDEHEFRAAMADQLRNFVTVFFLPIFFTFTGLRTNIGTLDSGQLWMFAALVSGLAVLGKFGGCGVAAWFGGFSLREAACIGTMMNTRALMELIVINVGFELHVIPASVFCMLVMMAVLTTIMTTPILLRLMPGTELEPYISQTPFRRDKTFAVASATT